jgi:hypothetical protein
VGGLGKGRSEWLAWGAALAGRQKEIHASRGIKSWRRPADNDRSVVNRQA